ncbi:DNA topoisomerase IB [Marinactinospora thermotolerans]|uniref:DNA topoisomerase n=1 Tax=Marinactinospora thermotolerans DSM 45154 TaxID=1122192 RepID=A0A1T4T380_9ACTN|nr:DNA topoisomerase IB [Marinactinospora thermotolerans]SKA34902.1 DNA topoisomerase IB [Marinactinospora thermotolerans DSM 45154]
MGRGNAIRRSDPAAPGIIRRRCGRGFRYLDPSGRPLRDEKELNRIRSLAIPPAWKDVWISPDPAGHIQALGTDDAGRRQYLYHEEWRAQRDRRKHDRVLEFSEELPKIRARAEENLRTRGFSRDRVLSAALRLIDLGFFRSGGEDYAENNESYGLATLLREHVTCSRGRVVFDYPAKSGKQREVELREPEVCRLVRSLKRREGGGDDLLAYRTRNGWHDVTSDDINGYLREITGGRYTAKDFRTWHATVLAAVGLAVSVKAPSSGTGETRAEARVVQEVAEYLGNTPAVARASYIDPRVFELYERGVTIASSIGSIAAEAEYGELSTQGEIEEAVRKMLRNA